MNALRPLFVRGLKFWFASVMASGVLQVDYLVMSQYLKPPDIVVYNLSAKIYLLIFFVYSSLLTATWPVCAEAATTNDWNTVLKLVRKNIIFGFALVILGTAIFLPFRHQIIGVLSPKDIIEVPIGLILLFGIYYLLRVWCDAFATVLASLSYMRPFVIYIPVQAMLTVVIQILITKEIGVQGILIGLIISYILTAVWIVPWVVFRKKSQLTSIYCK
jgi:O-antigen/teichoic acid export membrane protein